MMITSIVAPSFRDYRTVLNGLQYEISERHRHATCPFVLSSAVLFH
jgi:hypothetical protein